MKIVLIRTPIIQPKHHLSSLRAVPSIGLAYINAELRKNNCQVTVIDAPGEALFKFRMIEGTNLTINGLNAAEIVAKIPFDVDAVGLSAMHTSEWVYDSVIIDAVHQKFPNVPIFLGGESATANAEKILVEKKSVVAVVMGEGDRTVFNLVKTITSEEKDFSKINSIAYRDKFQNIIINKRVNPEVNPDIFGQPDWSGFPLNNYFEAKTSISAHNERSITMLATRGCPHTCTFCTVPNMWNSKWNPRTPENVVEEMIYYKNKYKIEHVDFVDLTFALNKEWTKKFCDLLIDQKVNMRWSLPIGTRVESLDFNLLKLMRQAGCFRILFSPESGSKLTLIRIKKKLNISKMEQVIRDSVNLGYVIKLATIFGFPGQTKSEVFGTMRFIWQAAWIGVRDVVCLSFIPYPGTELHDELVANGRFKPDQPVRLNNDIADMISWSENIPSWSMKYICFLGMASFYFLQFLFRPWRIIEFVKNIFILQKPQTNLESLIYCFFYRKTLLVE